MNDDFGDRLSASANAKTAKLEMAAQAKIAAENSCRYRAASGARGDERRARRARLRAEGLQVGDEEARG